MPAAYRCLRPVPALAFYLFLMTFSISARASQRQSTTDGSRGVFSADATSLWRPNAPRIWRTASPDHLKAIVVEEAAEGDVTDREAFITVGGKQQQLFAGHVDPEVLWSPDSKAFAETYSDGGAVGQFHVLIYYANGSRVIEPTNQVTEEFLSHPRSCFSPEDPNIAAIEWIKDSSEILVAAETLPHSNCDNMGTFRAYMIHLPDGNILRSYGQLEAKKLFWKHMGRELRNADDECIIKPGSCYIPQLHPDSQ
ncbi:MAG TPA: hypothetical protein VGT03_05225 [Candidatus Acidoferrales bacterium]|nr:hypothetical protein [Candidatus Acidoferrales bacterium]